VIVDDAFVPVATSNVIRHFQKRVVELEAAAATAASTTPPRLEPLTDADLETWILKRVEETRCDFSPERDDPLGWAEEESASFLKEKHPIVTDDLAWMMEYDKTGKKTHRYHVRSTPSEKYSTALVSGMSGLCAYVDEKGTPTYEEHQKMTSYKSSQKTREEAVKLLAGSFRDSVEAGQRTNAYVESLSGYEKEDLGIALGGGLDGPTQMKYDSGRFSRATHGTYVHRQIQLALNNAPFDASPKEVQMFLDLQKRDKRFSNALCFRTEFYVGTYSVSGDKKDLLRQGGKVDGGFYRLNDDGTINYNEIMVVDWKNKENLTSITPPDAEFQMLFPNYRGREDERLGLQLAGYTKAFNLCFAEHGMRATKSIIVLFPRDGVRAKLYEIVYNQYLMDYADFCRLRGHRIAAAKALDKTYDPAIDTAKFMWNLAKRVRDEAPPKVSLLFPDAGAASTTAPESRKRIKLQALDQDSNGDSKRRMIQNPRSETTKTGATVSHHAGL